MVLDVSTLCDSEDCVAAPQTMPSFKGGTISGGNPHIVRTGCDLSVRWADHGSLLLLSILQDRQQLVSAMDHDLLGADGGAGAVQ